VIYVCALKFLTENVSLFSDIRVSVILYLTDKDHKLCRQLYIAIDELWPHDPAFGTFTPAKICHKHNCCLSIQRFGPSKNIESRRVVR
jgi:hypothetical protein